MISDELCLFLDRVGVEEVDISGSGSIFFGVGPVFSRRLATISAVWLDDDIAKWLRCDRGGAREQY